MKKSITEIRKDFYTNQYFGADQEIPVGVARNFTPGGDAKFITRETYDNPSRVGQGYKATGIQPFNLWAHRHTITTNRETIIIRRDDDNQVVKFNYGVDKFNTICVKNYDEALKFNNLSGYFGGLYIVCWDTKKVYRVVPKLNNKCTIERVQNLYKTGLPWFKPFGSFDLERIWGGKLNCMIYQPERNGW